MLKTSETFYIWRIVVTFANHSLPRISETGEVFSEKLKAFTLELIDYKDKPEAYPKSQIEYWLYNLVNMESMTPPLPFQAQQPIFEKMGGISELTHMTREDRSRYMYSLNKYRTNLSVMKNERKEGLAEGLAKGRAEGRAEEKLSTARNLKSLGIPLELIAQATGLSIEEVAALYASPGKDTDCEEHRRLIYRMAEETAPDLCSVVAWRSSSSLGFPMSSAF